jgi:RNA polymerase sigma factor (TIGR02999 family)
LYGELRRIASSCLRTERREHTLQPTALVHEAYLRLAGQKNKDWKDRRHFLAMAAQAMRHVLVDSARTRYAQKRGGHICRLELDPNFPSQSDWSEELLDIDAALNRLAEIDPQQARIVELRFFAGLTEAEIAELIGCSERTIKREWVCARAWLGAELTRNRPPQGSSTRR